MADWKKGDLVEVKAGGPRMVIDDIHANGSVFCLWFDGKKRDSGMFAPETLKPSPEGGDDRSASQP